VGDKKTRVGSFLIFVSLWEKEAILMYMIILLPNFPKSRKASMNLG
jgi:hypothetical protein